MPRIDGIEAARRILDERPIPIVIVTAYGERELVARAVEAGVFGYLVKPFRETDVLPAIETARARHEELVGASRRGGFARRGARGEEGDRARKGDPHAAGGTLGAGGVRATAQGQPDLRPPAEGRRGSARSPRSRASEPCGRKPQRSVRSQQSLFLAAVEPPSEPQRQQRESERSSHDECGEGDDAFPEEDVQGLADRAIESARARDDSRRAGGDDA